MEYYEDIAASASANGETAADYRQLAQRLKMARIVASAAALGAWFWAGAGWAIALILLGFIWPCEPSMPTRSRSAWRARKARAVWNCA